MWLVKSLAERSVQGKATATVSNQHLDKLKNNSYTTITSENHLSKICRRKGQCRVGSHVPIEMVQSHSSRLP